VEKQAKNIVLDLKSLMKIFKWRIV